MPDGEFKWPQGSQQIPLLEGEGMGLRVDQARVPPGCQGKCHPHCKAAICPPSWRRVLASVEFTASNLAGSATLRAIVSVYAMPVLSGDSAVTLYEGEAANITVSATSGNNLAWDHSGTLPEGVSVASRDNTFTISGTPAEGTRGSYSYTFTAENYAGKAAKTVTINVVARSYEITSSDVSSAAALSGFLETLTAEQIAAIETLTLNEYVTDLSGIDALTSLTTLDLTQATGLTAIDLISNDTITTLDLAGNDSVTELNISGGAFVYVNAEGCSALSVVNAKDCANLETLLCGSCSISELYLSGCTSLKTLDFTDNAMRKFDARGFTALETLECAGQTITGQILAKSFAFRDFLNLAKVSVVEAESSNTLRASSISLTSDSDDKNVRDITGFDESGQEIDAVYDEAAGTLTFTEAPYKITYNYMTLDTLSMDVTVYGETAPALSGSRFTINATEGTAITALTITASGDNLVWTTSGSLPGGVSGAAASDAKSFTISGTPNAAGTFTYTVTASNSAGSADAVITVNVAEYVPPAEPEPEPEPVTSPDVTPEVSPDVSPDITPEASPDVPAPVSPDVPPEPESPDVPPVVSPDVPPEPESPDVPPVESPDVPPVVSPDVEPAESPDITPSPDDDNNNGGGGGDITPAPEPEQEVEAVSAEVEEPAVDIQEQSIVETIISVIRAISDAISNLINEDTEIAALPEEAAGSERTVDDLSDEDLAAIPEGQTPAVILPIITVTEGKIYVFGVSIPNLEAGAPIFWNPMAQDGAAAAGLFASVSDEDVNAYTFLTDDGEETAVVPANKHINVAAYLEPGKTYAPVITTEAATVPDNPDNPDNSGGNNGSDDNGNANENENVNVGSSGGGCSAGMNFAALALLAGMFLKRKQH